jgi:hypothetical protein
MGISGVGGITLANASIEQRVTELEKQLAQIKQQLSASAQPSGVPWWEKIAGTFADSEEYEEAMRLGREYRESLRPSENEQAA